MFYAIGYEKTEGSKRKIKIATNEGKAYKKYEELKANCFRVCLLKYGASAADYIILAQSENREEISEQCRIENAEE